MYSSASVLKLSSVGSAWPEGKDALGFRLGRCLRLIAVVAVAVLLALGLDEDVADGDVVDLRHALIDIALGVLVIIGLDLGIRQCVGDSPYSTFL